MIATFDRVKISLIEALQNTENKVICLKGSWGSGKTYLWDKIREEIYPEGSSIKPIRISLFGVKNIKDLKLKILQNVSLGDKATAKKVAGTITKIVKGVLARFSDVSADDLSLLWLPDFVKGRLIVLDDVERKNDLLDIDEVLGLIDEYSNEYKVKFLIILNTGKLNESEGMWDELHEKVIDAEVVLNPNASESFEIAKKGSSGIYFEELKKSVSILGINNIRVIKKIISKVAYISRTTGLSDIAPNRWVPSTVLLTAMHYRVIENAPSYEFIFRHNIHNPWGSVVDDSNEEEKHWESILLELGINSSDEFELILKEYLDTGFLDVDKLNQLFVTYKAASDNENIFNSLRSFYDRSMWDPTLSEDDLLEMATSFMEPIKELSGREASNLVFHVEKYIDVKLSKELLITWISFAEKNPHYQDVSSIEVDDFYGKLHPEIKHKLEEIICKNLPPLTLFQCMENIIKNSGWGSREQDAFENSTPAQYESEIRVNKNNELRRFFGRNLDWLSVKSSPFPKATSNFLVACNNIINSEPDSRLSKIIKSVFKGNRLDSLLEMTVKNNGSETNDQ